MTASQLGGHAPGRNITLKMEAVCSSELVVSTGPIMYHTEKTKRWSTPTVKARKLGILYELVNISVHFWIVRWHIPLYLSPYIYIYVCIMYIYGLLYLWMLKCLPYAFIAVHTCMLKRITYTFMAAQICTLFLLHTFMAVRTCVAYPLKI